jgi:hypothetical protein
MSLSAVKKTSNASPVSGREGGYTRAMKRSTPLLRRFGRMLLAASFLGVPVLAGTGLLSVAGFAQDQNFRSVDGKVLDKQNEPVKGAVVYLKDDHALTVKSYIATADGSYHFGQLSSSTDYTLWAESGDKKSSTKSISAFDTRKNFQYTLVLK